MELFKYVILIIWILNPILLVYLLRSVMLENKRLSFRIDYLQHQINKNQEQCIRGIAK